MDKQRASCGPVVAAVVLLLLPLLYVGSYFALVTPGQPFQWWNLAPPTYRVADGFCARFYWPVEQLDRKARPGAWEVPSGPAFKIQIFLCPSHPPEKNQAVSGSSEERAG